MTASLPLGSSRFTPHPQASRRAFTPRVQNIVTIEVQLDPRFSERIITEAPLAECISNITPASTAHHTDNTPQAHVIQRATRVTQPDTIDEPHIVVIQTRRTRALISYFQTLRGIVNAYREELEELSHNPFTRFSIRTGVPTAATTAPTCIFTNQYYGALVCLATFGTCAARNIAQIIVQDADPIQPQRQRDLSL